MNTEPIWNQHLEKSSLKLFVPSFTYTLIRVRDSPLFAIALSVW